MKRYYPKLADWAVICQLDGSQTEVKNDLTNESFFTDRGKSYLDFITALDGKNDPYELPSVYSRTERSLILRELSEHQLLREGRWLNKTLGEKSIAILVPKNHESASTLFSFLNKLLYALFLPIFVSGALFFQNSYVELQGVSVVGVVMGVLLGIILHEAAHACATLSYGGKLYEAGVHLTYMFLPGAYILTSFDDHLAPQKQIQTFAAGIEMNAALSGLFFFLASLVPQWGDFFFCMAWINFAFALINLIIFGGSDGCRILSVFFGLCPNEAGIVSTAWEYVSDRCKREFLFSRGIGGRIKFYSYCVILLLQVVIPILAFATLLEVIMWFA